MSTLGQTFHDIRESKGLTLKEIADSEVSVAAISKFEHDQTSISTLRLLHLLDQVNVTTTDFFYRYFDRYQDADLTRDWNTNGASFGKLLSPFRNFFRL